MDTRVLVAIILVAGVAGGFASNYVGDYYSDDEEVEETQTSMSEVKLGAEAPDFTVEDIEGNTFNLSDFEGQKVVVIEFMNTGCGTCHNFEKKVLKEYYNDTERPDDVEIISITQNVESKSKVSDRSDEIQANWTWAIGNDEITSMFKAERSPSVVIVDKEGIVTFCESGTMSKAALENEVNTALE